MKKILFLLLSLPALFAGAANETSITITDLNNNTLTQNIERNLSSLITELNNAWEAKREPNWKLCKSWADDRTCKDLSMLWAVSPMRCTEEEVVEIGMSTYGGEYEVRNIPFILTTDEGDKDYHEVAVTFNGRGLITSFHLMISNHLYRTVMQYGGDNPVTDMRRRQMILDFVEQFRTAYNTKDLNFLNQIFSEDAVIITGKVIEVKPSRENNFQSSKIKYSKQDKKTYLTNLSRVFKANEKIIVTFDDIKVEMHPIEEDVYGVTLHQGWSSKKYGNVDGYHEDGYLFLLWNFKNELKPEIRVRTWQPDFNSVTKQKIKEDEIFGLADCPV